MSGFSRIKYFYIAQENRGAVIIVVNPKQAFAKIELPAAGPSRLLFADAGYTPEIENNIVTLGPEQLAVC